MVPCGLLPTKFIDCEHCGKALKNNKPRIRKGAQKGWQGNVKRPNTDTRKAAPNTFIEYIDLILFVPFRSLGVFALWKCWPFKETTIIDDIGEASGLPLLARVTLMLWGVLNFLPFGNNGHLKAKANRFYH
ncbi:uncharacterized protein LOC128225671 [Mya arenaria]|uniref:uncharacterized protein LOC128225671 n=1 Tax=Mya arenaria TaxID=6604 RepID=UPI0022E1A84D|nr:uncharacterized protein LOC128225671 [Mya arenaria]